MHQGIRGPLGAISSPDTVVTGLNLAGKDGWAEAAGVKHWGWATEK